MIKHILFAALSLFTFSWSTGFISMVLEEPLYNSIFQIVLFSIGFILFTGAPALLMFFLGALFFDFEKEVLTGKLFLYVMLGFGHLHIMISQLWRVYFFLHLFMFLICFFVIYRTIRKRSNNEQI